MFAYAIDQRKSQPWIVMALDPGVMLTNLYRWVPGLPGSALNCYFGSYVGRYFVNDSSSHRVCCGDAREDDGGARVCKCTEQSEILWSRRKRDTFFEAELSRDIVDGVVEVDR